MKTGLRVAFNRATTHNMCSFCVMKWMHWFRVAISMLVTGTIAIGISICTLIAPLETHPFSDDAP